MAAPLAAISSSSSREDRAGKQRRVAHRDEDGGGVSRNGAQSLPDGIGRAALRVLADTHRTIAEGLLDGVGPAARDDHGARDAGIGECCEHVVDHRTPGERVQYLRDPRAHADPLPCGQDDRSGIGRCG